MLVTALTAVGSVPLKAPSTDTRIHKLYTDDDETYITRQYSEVRPL